MKDIGKAVFFMMTKKIDKKRDQMMVFCMDDMVPQDHLLRLIDRAIDWSFIYDLVEGTYCHDNGRPSMDPVMLIKIPFIQYLYGIRSMRQTIREIEVNVAYRWSLGLDMMTQSRIFLPLERTTPAVSRIRTSSDRSFPISWGSVWVLAW